MHIDLITRSLSNYACFFCLLPIWKSKWNVLYKFYGLCWIASLLYLFQWVTREKIYWGIYNSENLLIYAFLDLCTSASVYLANLSAIANAVFFKSQKYKIIVDNIAQMEVHLKTSANSYSLRKIKLQILSTLAFSLGFTVVWTAVYQYYLGFELSKLFLAYSLNVMMFLINWIVQNTIIGATASNLATVNERLAVALSNYTKGFKLVSQRSIPELQEYCGYYKTAFKAVGLLNSFYGSQMLIMAFLNCMVIIYNMYISTMDKMGIAAIPEAFLLMTSIYHTLIYLV